jgi:creatinine amidohydrolase
MTDAACSPRPWVLSETNYAYVNEHPYDTAVLPLGATEPHNLHLPYGTDCFQCDEVGERICAAAHARGAKVVLLPTMPYGTETNMQRFPLAMNVDPSTLARVIGDLVRTLVTSGIRKVVLLNGHGGNDLKPVLRELHDKTEAKLFLCNWYTVAADAYREIFVDAGDHAGEMETAMMLAYRPRLVVKTDDGKLAADDGAVQTTRFEAVNRGWVTITRPWHLLTTNTGVGNPHPATAEKAAKTMEIVVARLSQFLVDLSAAKLDESFPY